MCTGVKNANLSSSGCWLKWLPLVVQILVPSWASAPPCPSLDFGLPRESRVHSWQDRKNHKMLKMFEVQMKLDFWKVSESLSSPWVVLLSREIRRKVAERGSFPGKVLTHEPEISSSVFKSNQMWTGIFWVFKQSSRASPVTTPSVLAFLWCVSKYTPIFHVCIK